MDEGGISNIVSQKRVREFSRITYDSNNDDGFVVVHRGNGSIRNFRESPSGLHYIDMEDIRSSQMDAVVINVNNNSTGVGGRELDTIDDDYGDMPDLVELETMDNNSIDDEVSRLIKQEIKVSSSKENEADGFTRPLKGKKIELG